MNNKKKLLNKNFFKIDFLKKNSFSVYGLGETGKSAINLFKKKKIKFVAWDDNIFNKNNQIKKSELFTKSLDDSNWILMSPGINIEKSRFKNKILKNKNKIISDLDLFYLLNPKVKSILVTGTNGKSTTCKIIEHVLKKNRHDVQLGGNIGKPVLNLNYKKNCIYVIEASSFQLFYSKFISPKYAIILNITKDHLDWHKTKKNYIYSKFKIFMNQSKNDMAFLKNKKLIDIYRKKKFKAKLKKVSIKNYFKIKKQIKNIYLKSLINDENMSFVYSLMKELKITSNSFINTINSFKGLPHRHEIFYKKSGITFVNDSKATSFEATKFALMANKNIYWILGGLPKKNDIFVLQDLKEKIIKSFIIGKHINFFKSQLKGKVKSEISYTLDRALKRIFKELKTVYQKKIVVLFSPASASYDQYKNFNERGNHFKKLVKIYGNKHF